MSTDFRPLGVRTFTQDVEEPTAGLRAIRCGTGLSYKFNRTALTSVALGEDYEVDCVGDGTSGGYGVGTGSKTVFNYSPAAGADPGSSAPGVLIVYVNSGEGNAWAEQTLTTNYTIAVGGGSITFKAGHIPAAGKLVRISFTYAVEDTFPPLNEYGVAGPDDDTPTVYIDGELVTASDYTIQEDGSILFDPEAEPAKDAVVTVKIFSAAAAAVVAGAIIWLDSAKLNRPLWDSIIPSATKVCEVM
jgi:hypothetical protein